MRKSRVAVALTSAVIVGSALAVGVQARAASSSVTVTFLKTLAGQSQAAMYSSGLIWDPGNPLCTHATGCIVVADTAEGQDDESGVWGVISDFDLLRARMRPDAPDTVVELAQQPVITVETTAALRNAAELMLTKDSSHLVAVNPETRRPVGVLSTLDIAGVLAWGEM